MVNSPIIEGRSASNQRGPANAAVLLSIEPARDREVPESIGAVACPIVDGRRERRSCLGLRPYVDLQVWVEETSGCRSRP